MALETSSPLAALQPRAMNWANMGQTYSLFKPFMPAELGCSRASRPNDYFSFRPVRGSSPTQSLAVDLSQNFHIDQSPRVPTPRRALFTTSLAGPRQENVITPPITSSPAPDDAMDMSPLPHKLPCRVDVLCSPTPEPSPWELKPAITTAQSLESQERVPRRLDDLRNGRLGIRKVHSSSSVLRKPKAEKTFFFGGSSTILKPLEVFAESPPSASADPIPLLAALSGSPVNAPRRPAIGRQRSGMSRRTLSMQYNDSGRALRAEKRCCTTGSLQAPAVFKDSHKPKLPHFVPDDEVEGLPRITNETFFDILSGKLDVQPMIVDCRFEYEYQGGHVIGAVNFNDKLELEKELFGEGASPRTVIFHCEYSKHRAPIMARHIRQRDRAVNQEAYPHLSFPEIYILDGGYKGFFAEHAELCFPQSYVEMDAKEHESACARGLARVRQRGKLTRAQTFAFGQSAQPPLMAKDSPTLLRSSSHNVSMDLDDAL